MNRRLLKVLEGSDSCAEECAATLPGLPRRSREALAAVAFVALLTLSFALQQDHVLIFAVVDAVVGGLVVFVLLRFGVLSMVVIIIVVGILEAFPLSADLLRWYAGSTIFALAMVLFLATFACRTAVAGRPLIRDELLET